MNRFLSILYYFAYFLFRFLFVLGVFFIKWSTINRWGIEFIVDTRRNAALLVFAISVNTEITLATLILQKSLGLRNCSLIYNTSSTG